MRNKIEDLQRALTGYVKDNHRLMLTLHLEHIDELNGKLTRLEEEIDRLVAPFDEDDLIERFDEITGIDKKTAQVVIAELGIGESANNGTENPCKE